MKEGLNQHAIQRIATALTAVYPDFNAREFIATAVAGIEPLALRQRVDFLISVLARYLPQDFIHTADVLTQLPTHWDGGQVDDPLRNFAAWPVIDYIAVYGLQHPQHALPLLKRLTPLFSAEFALRPFLLQHQALTLTHCQQWCHDADKHVRRLASEGTRPRLPWGKQLKPFIADPSPVLALLEQLKDDDSDYVRRSVANNLNDIAKDHPQQVIDRCTAWQQADKPRRDWLIRHACRTLVKQGYAGVYRLLGYTETPQVTVHSLTLTPTVLSVGDSLAFKVTIQAKPSVKTTQKMVIDYTIHYQKANGKTSAKVFKLKNITLAQDESIVLSKKHSFRPVTVRTYYAGQHWVEILVNGKGVVSQVFNLLTH